MLITACKINGYRAFNRIPLCMFFLPGVGCAAVVRLFLLGILRRGCTLAQAESAAGNLFLFVFFQLFLSSDSFIFQKSPLFFYARWRKYNTGIITEVSHAARAFYQDRAVIPIPLLARLSDHRARTNLSLPRSGRKPKSGAPTKPVRSGWCSP